MDGIGIVIDHLKCEAKELPAPRHPGPILSRFPYTRLEVRRSAVGISVRFGQDGVAPPVPSWGHREIPRFWRF